MKISKLVLNVSLALMAGVASTHASAANVRSSASAKPGTEPNVPACSHATKVERYADTAVNSPKSVKGSVPSTGNIQGQK